MTAEVDSLPQTSGPPKRRMRNFLLDKRFQLKYTGMVVAVTVVVAAVLGWFAYDYSRGQTESLSITIMMQPELNPEAAADIEAYAEARDRQVLLAIGGGILILALTLGFTGIVVTHKVVGPSYKMRRLFREIAAGHLKVDSKLRKGDELQDVFQAFEEMVSTLRTRQTEEVAQLDIAIEKARASGAPDEAIAEIVAVRDRMQSALE